MGLMDMFSARSQQGSPTVTTTATTTSTVAPAPTVRQIRLHPDNAFPWKRLSISIVGIMMILFVWRWSVDHLYTLPPTSIAVYGSITISTLYAITFIVAFFITGQAYFTNWSNVSTSNITAMIQQYIDSNKGKKKDKDDSQRKG